MALNFSHRSIFPGGVSEDNLVSPMRMGNGYRVEGSGSGDGFGSGSGSGDGFSNGWHDVENCFDYGMDRCDRGAGSTQDSASKGDIIDRLPSDPFGMDISSTFTAITGWLEDLDFDYSGYRGDELGSSGDNYPLFAGLNFIWNNAVRFHTFPHGENAFIEDNKFQFEGVSGFGECSQREVGEASCSSFGYGSSSDMDGVLGFGSEYKDVAIASVSGDTNMDDVKCLEGDIISPHSSIIFSLSYLGLSDLLSVERVCKYLHSYVRGESFLWKSIHVGQPLNERITDDILLELANRARGGLECLSLVECSRITDDGLRRVLEANPKIIKLSVPGCTRLSVEGIVDMLKAYNSMGTQGVKHLHIGGLYGITQKQFDELNFLLGTDTQLQQHPHKPHFYCRGNLYLTCDDDRAIDIEVCPRCQNLRLVYDCPAEGCQGVVGRTTQVCRACTLCIPRCSQCGRCINDSEYEETFCLELLCCSCSQYLVKCLGRVDGKVATVSSVPRKQS